MILSLREKLGLVEMENFITPVNTEAFDYTRWREPLFEEMPLEELSSAAMENRKKKRSTISDQDE